jgi:hypothetical protein
VGDGIKDRLDRLRTVLNATVSYEIREYPLNYHTASYAGRVYAEIALPHCEQLGYDQIKLIAETLGTTEINFQSAHEGGWYGECDDIVRLWACWPKEG